MTTGVDAYSTTAANNGTLGATDYFKEGQAPSTVNDAARQVMADIAAWFGQAKSSSYLTGTAGTNTVTATGPASMAAYTAGQFFTIIPANTNSGATTLNITPSGGAALGAKNIFSGNAALVGGEFRANIPVALFYDGTQFQIIVNISKQPTRQTKTSGSGTYTTPSGATRLYVRLVAAGGGGGGAGTSGATNGGTGGNTTFSTLTGTGGGGGVAGSSGAAGTAGAGGGGSGGSVNLTGGNGCGTDGANGGSGGQGGASAFGGNGGGGTAQAGAGSAGATNTGGGGGGSSGTSAGFFAAGGGGAGGYVEVIITAPSATYSYGVGAAGTAGGAGVAGAAGGAGGSGFIIVDEFYD